MKTINQTKQDYSIEKLLLKMLKENTGIAICDSGGIGGRGWQRNQGLTLKKCLKRPEVTWEGEYYGIDLFHFLRRDLELNALCNEFNKKFIPTFDWEGSEIENVYGVSKAGVLWLQEQSFKFREIFNSYNGESNLSQIIQGTWLKHEITGDYYLLLQIHGGADARGGYTDARLFKCLNYEDGAFLEDVCGTVTKPDGTQYNVDNLYDGVSLRTGDNGDQEIEINKNDKVELELMER